MKTLVSALMICLALGFVAVSAQSASDQAVVQECTTTTGNQAYAHWKGKCQSADGGTDVAACYCAAAAMLRCCIAAAPNNPNAANWKQAYDQNIQNAQNMGTTCFKN